MCIEYVPATTCICSHLIAMSGPSEAGWQGRPGPPHFLYQFFFVRPLNFELMPESAQWLRLAVAANYQRDKVHQSFSFHFPQREFGSCEVLVSAAVV